VKNDLLEPYSGEETIRRFVSPEYARELRATCHYEHQRPISQEHVNRLKFEMDDGRFRPWTNVAICVLPDGCHLIVNGNHTLEAIGTGKRSVPIQFDYYKVSKMDEVARIYATFDRQRKRSHNDAARAAGLSAPNLSKSLASMAYIIADFSKMPFSVARNQLDSSAIRIEYVKAYDRAIRIFDAILKEHASSSKIKNALLQAPVGAIGIVTCFYQEHSAIEFWSKTAADDGLRRGDPAHTLLDWLKSERSRRNGERTLIAAASCWNAHYRKETVNYVKPSTALSKVYILGTPWNRRERSEPAQHAVSHDTLTDISG